MQSGYPLIVDQNGWGVASLTGSDPRRPDSTSLLRAIGNDLSRTAQLKAAIAAAASGSTSSSPHEIIVRESPLPSYCYDYPQNPFLENENITRHSSLRIKRKPQRPTTLNHHGSPVSNRIVSFNRGTVQQHLIDPDLELFEHPTRRQQQHNFVGETSSSPMQRSDSSSPRVSRKEQHHQTNTRVPLIDQEMVQMPDNLEHHHSSYSLTATHPKQFVLCCSPPGNNSYYYNQERERLRQEPEPGLCDCCDAKVSCCCACCHTWCPTGHVNSVCTSLICFGIILFIVLSPLLHYLVPT